MMFMEREYEAAKQHLKIDTLDLETEFIEQPPRPAATQATLALDT